MDTNNNGSNMKFRHVNQDTEEKTTTVKWRKWNGVSISDSTRETYAEEAISALLDAPQGRFHFFDTGDMLVIALRDPETGHIEVIDCSIRRRADVVIPF